VSRLRIAGLLLLAGAAITFGLHFMGAPEDLYRWLYHHTLSSRDVPKDPSPESVDAIQVVSYVGGLAELAAGVFLVTFDAMRGR
jgi:hypothetical protein